MGGCHAENNRRKQKDTIIEGTINSPNKINEVEPNKVEEKKTNGDNDLVKSQDNNENNISENEINKNSFIEENNKNNDITKNHFIEENNKNKDITENNFIEENNKDNDLTENHFIENNNKNNDLTGNDNKINHWLICPDCSERSPHIEKLYYDKNTNNFSVKYSCICHDNINYPKEALLVNIISNREPQNLCIIHPEQKLVNFCKDCGKAICNICKSENHNNHILEENNENFSKEDSIKMLEIINQKEKQFNIEINKNEEKMENGINNEIEKLKLKKQNYKNDFEKYRNDNQKTFFFLKNLCNRYINNANANENNSNDSGIRTDIGTDVMLANHINKFKIIDNNNQKLNSNLDEIINNYKDEQKDLKLEYDYGINVIDGFSLEVGRNGISEKKNSNDKREFSCTKTFEGHTEKIVSLIELSSGQLASGSYDNTIRIWNTNTLKEDEIINENGRIFALLEFEKNKLLCGTSNNCINLWEINSPTKVNHFSYSFTGHELWVISLVKCSQDFFASGSNDSKIKIWDYYNKKCIGTLSGHLDCILSLILLKNNNLCSGSADNTIKLWDWIKGKCIATLRGHEKWVKCIYELDNGIILSGSDDKTIRLWKDKKQISVLKGHEHSVRVFCQINSNYFASGGFDNIIKIWEIKTLKCVQNLIGHKSNIICLITLKNYNNDNNNQNSICSSSNDKTIKIWEGTL